MVTSKKVVYDLCAGTGNWSKYYRDNRDEYEVVMVDLPNDVRLLEHPDRPVYGVLAAPPCTAFSLLNNFRPMDLTNERIREGLSIVDACIRFAITVHPRFWALENPKGYLVNYLGDPAYKFCPSEFGCPYTKKTYLWGNFNHPRKQKKEQDHHTEFHQEHVLFAR